MDYSLLDSIYSSYVDNIMDNMSDTVTEEEYNFKKKYIAPVSAENTKNGDKMSDMFNLALAASNEKSFKNGFKTCMRLVWECFN